MISALSFADTTYDVTVLMNPKTVTEMALATALKNLLMEGITVTPTDTDPTEEMRAISGIYAASVETFATAAAVAAGALSIATEAETLVPLPLLSPRNPSTVSPSLPPPRFVCLDYESSASGLFADIRRLFFAPWLPF